MGRRGRGGGSGNLTAMMDIMTAAIGCLVLVLISCLMLVLITNVSIYFGDPNNMAVGSGTDGEWGMNRYVQVNYGDYAHFPHGNTMLSPDYIDVHPEHLVFYPSREVMSIYDIREPGNAFQRQLEKFTNNEEYGKENYIVLLIRPYTATIANELRRQIRQAGISIGFELMKADEKVDFRSAAEWEAEQAAEAAAREAEAATQEP